MLSSSPQLFLYKYPPSSAPLLPTSNLYQDCLYNNINTHKEKMSVTISQLSSINMRWIYLRKFNLSLRCQSYQLHTSPQSKFLQTWSKSIIHYRSISIESRSCNSCIKFTPSFLHSTNNVDNRSHLCEFKLVEHFTIR